LRPAQRIQQTGRRVAEVLRVRRDGGQDRGVSSTTRSESMTDTNKTGEQFWHRLGVVAACVWVGLVALLSATQRGFYWFFATHYYESSFGPAFIVAVVGVLIIGLLAIGIPWILAHRTSQQFWQRLRIIVSAAWVGFIIILSAM